MLVEESTAVAIIWHRVAKNRAVSDIRLSIYPLALEAAPDKCQVAGERAVDDSHRASVFNGSATSCFITEESAVFDGQRAILMVENAATAKDACSIAAECAIDDSQYTRVPDAAAQFRLVAGDGAIEGFEAQRYENVR